MRRDEKLYSLAVGIYNVAKTFPGRDEMRKRFEVFSEEYKNVYHGKAAAETESMQWAYSQLGNKCLTCAADPSTIDKNIALKELEESMKNLENFRILKK